MDGRPWVCLALGQRWTLRPWQCERKFRRCNVAIDSDSWRPTGFKRSTNVYSTSGEIMQNQFIVRAHLPGCFQATWHSRKASEQEHTTCQGCQGCLSFCRVVMSCLRFINVHHTISALAALLISLSSQWVFFPHQHLQPPAPADYQNQLSIKPNPLSRTLQCQTYLMHKILQNTADLSAHPYIKSHPKLLL
jgi:hypothetical protein